MSGVATGKGTGASAVARPDAAVDRESRRWLFWILAAALVLRVAWALYAARAPAGLTDPLVYLSEGRAIAHGDGYIGINGAPTAYFPIGYPAFIAGVTWIVNHTPLTNVPRTLGVVQAVVSTVSVYLVWRIARAVAPARTALLAAAIVAVFPGLLLYSAAVLSETLFVALELAAVAVIVEARWAPGAPSWRRIAAFGLLTGLAALVRPQALLLVVVLSIALAIARFGWRRSLAAGAVALAVAVVPIVPWTVRNAITMDAFVPISTNTGDDLCIGHNPAAYGGFEFAPACEGVRHLGGARAEVERDRKNTRGAVKYAFGHPGREGVLFFKKLYYLYLHDHGAVEGVESYGHHVFLPDTVRRALRFGSTAYFFAVVLLGLAGIPLLARRGDPRSTFVVLALVAMALAPVIFFGDARFHVPASPLFAIAAALTLARLAALRSARRP